VRKLYIFGAGEFAQIAASYFSREGRYKISGFIIHGSYSPQRKLPYSVFRYEDIRDTLTQDDVEVFVAISASKMNTLRQGVFEELEKVGVKFASFISSSAFVSETARIGKNVFVFENNVIQENVQIGNNTILWSGNHIGHRSLVGNNVFISSHVVVSGFCEIKKNCYLGVNSTIVDKVTIPPFTIIGAGSLVTKSLDLAGAYVGSPARLMEGKQPMDVEF
jgi:sugar O-acyltransferase (sialic acid O-acetyltransferase NeuD family)